jgi:hypothetical protein
MKRNIIILLTVALGFSSCFKEDEARPPNPKSPVEQKVIPLTQNYINQVYFRLSDGELPSINQKNEYDLCFSSVDTGTLIRLNSANFMKAAITNEGELEKVSDTVGLVWLFDKSDGNPDSTALIDWISIDGTDTSYVNKVYVINRGIDERGFPVGLMKVLFKKMSGDAYHFTYSNMDNTGMKDITVTKNPGHNSTQFSFEEEGFTDQLEPKTENWDLLFTQYTTLLYTDDGEAYPYLVTGALTNLNGTRVALDSTLIFNDIVLEDVLELSFSSEQDKIGYDWKELVGDPTGGDFYYKPRTDVNYLILSQRGIFYKLRFTGFYDPETGEKGYPTFEFQRL